MQQQKQKQAQGKYSKLKKKPSKLIDITQNSREELKFLAFSESRVVKKMSKKACCNWTGTYDLTFQAKQN